MSNDNLQISAQYLFEKIDSIHRDVIKNREMISSLKTKQKMFAGVWGVVGGSLATLLVTVIIEKIKIGK